MKVFRFMSDFEFIRYCDKQVLINNTVHSNYSKSTSKGFCFLNLDEYKPEEAFHFLTGIVSPDICAIFEVDDSKKLKEESGLYNGSNYIIMKNTPDYPYFTAKEYCTNFYSYKDMKLVKYCRPVCDSFEWKWIGGEKL